MALKTITGAKNIPEDGIRLTKSDALEFQKKIIKNWKSLSEVVFLEYGSVMSSMVTFASACYINKTMRSMLNMGSHLKFISYVASSVTPSVLSGFWTERKVTENTLLMTTKCPMCMHLQFGLGQVFYGVIFPAIGGLAFHLPTANYHNTIPLPDISNDTKKGYIFIFKLLKSKASIFQVVAALQIPFIFLLPYLQAKQLNNITNILNTRNSEELK